ncbi:MAG: RNA polymerase sigma-70 factor [Prevotella sp.]|nr:RNA polymerase sigma-70 factor [Prevotella sp.]MBQ6033368.1 RNA polymerase sigma-70 factor [Prevotella sp.]MBQ6657820.1 RNA polymerase sigma-70 factor [Prevotella sp.]MBQ7716782.1 RNA polymerase sigma-70 factor [Prevotella sp.]
MIPVPNILSMADFTRFVNENQRRFIQFVTYYLHDEVEAEDVVMQTFMAVWQSREQVTTGEELMSYTLTILKNKSINVLRHKMVVDKVNKKLKETAAWDLNLRMETLSAFNPNDIYSKEIISIIEQTLKEMPSRTSSIFLKSRVHGMSYAEIAAEEGMTEKGVAYHVRRVLDALRITLKDYLPVFLLLFVDS